VRSGHTYTLRKAAKTDESTQQQQRTVLSGQLVELGRLQKSQAELHCARDLLVFSQFALALAKATPTRKRGIIQGIAAAAVAAAAHKNQQGT
jgi:hypothetical protein